MNRIAGELKNIHQWTLSNQTYTTTRSLLEHIPLFHTDKHDRVDVDDSHYEKMRKTIQMEFASFADIQHFVESSSYQIRVMTDFVWEVDFSDLNTARKNPQRQRDIRTRLLRILHQQYPHISESASINVSWKYKDARWEAMHNMRERFQGSNDHWCSQLSCSVNEDYTKMNVVVWKSAFYEKDPTRRVLQDALEDDRTAFLYQTTEKTWRFYNRNEMRKVGQLVHS